MEIKSKIRELIRRSRWFNETVFRDCRKFWSLHQYDLDVVNLGSSSGVHAFDYDGLGVKGMNWAMPPQSLLMDFAILKNYLSYLKTGATVIISLCPFSCLVGYDIYVRDRYYTIIRHNTIPNFNYKRYLEIMNVYNYPERYYPLFSIKNDLKYWIKHILGIDGVKQKTNKELEVDAITWRKNWMKEFSISDFSRPLLQKNMDNYEDASSLLGKIISFCLERELKPVLCYPPVTPQLRAQFDRNTTSFLMEKFAEKSNNRNIPFLNYWSCKDFDDITLYENSYFLNLRGRKLFTNRVLKDLKLI